ncbi:Selenocysteine lyase [Nymphon striatum]|nr:Selenocysteine lyase [Nymphon striatum]
MEIESFRRERDEARASILALEQLMQAKSLSLSSVEGNDEKVYFDYNATTPLDSEVLDQITAVLKNNWANPSSSYKIGKDAKNVVESARLKVAEMIFAQPEDIIFTSGGTEANHMIITSVIKSYNEWLQKTGQNGKKELEKPHIITSNLEHDSISLLLRNLEENNIIELTVIPACKKEGKITLNSLETHVRSSTCLISIMLANNETGIIQVIGSWTEFNIRTRDNVTVKPDKVGYLPTINAPATELSTVQELLSQSVFIQQHLSLDKIAVIMDQTAYAKAAEVAWKHKLRFESLLLMMGNFHIICNMLSIIGKLFRDAGLRDLAVESGVIAEGSIDKVLDGKQYNRGVRLHKLTYEALM